MRLLSAVALLLPLADGQAGVIFFYISSDGVLTRLTAGAVVPPPQLTIIHSQRYMLLTWPTNAAGFTLQSTTSLASSSVWTAVPTHPVVVNGQNTVTNPFPGTQFFRLSQ